MQDAKKVLLTGATGYIGRRLKEKLLSRDDLDLTLLVRNAAKVRASVQERVRVVEGDTFNAEALQQATQGVDTAFYLIHSMGAGDDFEELDRKSAENFRRACIAAGVRRIVYLGGLGVEETASKHLLSRIETGRILSEEPEKIQTIWFRAGVIIGAGSASFEIICNLVQKLPMMVTPRWVTTKTQPIGINDVLAYLESAIDLDYNQDLVVDIGAEVMSFKEMMAETARVMRLHRLLIPVPLLSPTLSSYWLILFTSVPYKVAAALVDGLKSETLVLNDNSGRFFPDVRPEAFARTVEEAVKEMEDDQVLSRWCDSSAGIACDVHRQDDTHMAIYRDERKVELGGASPEQVFRAACTLGGEKGWFRYNFLWELRGVIDKLQGGYGLNRGRRDQSDLRVGDALDFWKVADIKPNKRLLLVAQMKLPGKAWLEFDIQDNVLTQTAHFIPKGLLGRLYWYSVLPLHHLVFEDMSRSLVEKAEKS